MRLRELSDTVQRVVLGVLAKTALVLVYLLGVGPAAVVTRLSFWPRRRRGSHWRVPKPIVTSTASLRRQS